MSKKWIEYGTNTYPSITINNLSFRGQINPDNVFEAICASYKQMPFECTKWLEFEKIPYKKNMKNTVSTKELIMIVGTLVACNIAFVFFYRKNRNTRCKEWSDVSP